MINEQHSKTKHSSWWKRRTQMEKWLILLLVFLLVAIIIILSVKIAKRKTIETSDICFTQGCIHTASKILKKVDLSADPCEDFYKFSCGSFIRNTVLSQSQTYVSSFSIVSDMVDKQMRTLLEKPIEKTDARPFTLVKSIYQACMNTTAIETYALDDFKNILSEAGGWPVIEGDTWNENAFNWTTTLYKFINYGFYTDMFFEINVSPDVVNSSQNILKIDQPYIVSFAKLMKRGFNESIVQAYYDYMVSVAEAFGADKETAQREMKDVINLDITLTKISIPAENRRNSSLEDNKMTINELQSKFSYVPWLQYINTMLYPIKKLTPTDTVTVTVPQYFTDLQMVILGTPKRTLANYIQWKIVKSMITYLNEHLRNLQLKFSKTASGRSEREPRWKECIHKTKSLYIASGALYVRNFFNQESKKSMLELVNNIQSQFIEDLKTVDWMDDVTRQHAIAKAKRMESYIAYPEQLLDEKEIDTYHKNLTVNPLKYLESMQNVTRFTQQLSYADLDKSTDEKDWRQHAYAVVTNAFYDENRNSIEFPASLLQDVFFDNDRPQYMNYGAIGYIIGHEITHGFDDEGRQFDKDGNLVDWWQPKTKTAFDAKAQCIIDQYGNFTVPGININLNGINAQGENIADNGGLKQAYLAYKRWVKNNKPENKLPGLPYSPAQLFWISVGTTWCTVERSEQLKISVLDRPHSPSYYRVNVPLMNSNAFATDFNCPSGSNMNPKHKCTVW